MENDDRHPRIHFLRLSRHAANQGAKAGVVVEEGEAAPAGEVVHNNAGFVDRAFDGVKR